MQFLKLSCYYICFSVVLHCFVIILYTFAHFCILLLTFSNNFIMLNSFAYIFIPLHTNERFGLLLHTFAYFCTLVHTFAYFCILLHTCSYPCILLYPFDLFSQWNERQIVCASIWGQGEATALTNFFYLHLPLLVVASMQLREAPDKKSILTLVF